MAVRNINAVVVTGNLTRDPELRSIPSGSSVCKLRLAVNSRAKDARTGEWVDRPNYFDVDVFGSQADHAAEHLTKGRSVAVQGSLVYREWESQGGGKRSAVSIKAEGIQFLGSKAGRPASASATEESPESAEVEFTPQARTKAEELGVDLDEVTPKDGKKVRASDVEAHAAA